MQLTEKDIEELLEDTKFGAKLQKQELVAVKVVFNVDRNSAKSFEKTWGYKGDPGKQYTYKGYADLKLQAGDYAVVDSPTHGLTVVTVVEVTPWEGGHSGYKLIYGRVDRGGYEELARKAIRRKEILQTLSRKTANALRLKTFEELLGTDKEAAALIRELKSI